MPEFPEMSHLFPDLHLDATSCRAGLVRCLFSKPLHYLLLILLAIDVLTVVVGRKWKREKAPSKKQEEVDAFLFFHGGRCFPFLDNFFHVFPATNGTVPQTPKKDTQLFL